MFRSFTLMTIVASTLGGCRAPSTAPHFQSVAGRDASAATGTVDRVVGPNAPADPAAFIEYRGETIGLTKRYDDFDTFKNDPNNIAPAEYERVRKLVQTAPVPEHCADSHEVFAVMSSLEFPGYGSGGIGEAHATDPVRVIGETIEIPHADADRVVIYLKDDHGYRLVDDTVLPELPIMAEVTVRDGKVTYRTREGTVIAERPIRGHADR
jgi:hypothetical protein